MHVYLDWKTMTATVHDDEGSCLPGRFAMTTNNKVTIAIDIPNALVPIPYRYRDQLLPPNLYRYTSLTELINLGFTCHNGIVYRSDMVQASYLDLVHICDMLPRTQFMTTRLSSKLIGTNIVLSVSIIPPMQTLTLPKSALTAPKKKEQLTLNSQ